MEHETWVFFLSLQIFPGKFSARMNIEGVSRRNAPRSAISFDCFSSDFVLECVDKFLCNVLV